MALNKIEQFHHENLTWERSLDFFKQENIFLKNRLAEVVDHSGDKEFLAMAEHFQNQFILKDEFIDELQHDIHEQEMKLKNEVRGDISGEKNKIAIKQSKLRNEIGYFEKNFSQLKNEFNRWLLQEI